MNRIEQLIKEFCPNGVEYKKLGDIATYIFRGAGITRDQVTEEGTPCVRYGEIYTTYGIYFDTATIGEHALIRTPFVCNQQITCFSLKNEYQNDIEIKYFFYLFFKFGEWCKNNVNKGGGLPIINSTKLATYKIPIPPIEEQTRIMNILDRFDKLCNDILEGLPAEIEARRKQYEYYRDRLLSFEKN